MCVAGHSTCKGPEDREGTVVWRNYRYTHVEVGYGISRIEQEDGISRTECGRDAAGGVSTVLCKKCPGITFGHLYLSSGREPSKGFKQTSNKFIPM